MQASWVCGECLGPLRVTNEKLTGATFRFIPEKPIKARHVQYRVTNKRAFDVTELEVLDRIEFKPFDLRIALPDEKALSAAR